MDVATQNMYKSDCGYLYSFFSGNYESNDPRKVVEILTRRNMEAIKIIRLTYRVLYNHDLLHLLSQGNNPFARAAYLRASEPSARDAEIIRGALFGNNLDLNKIVEIICTRPTSELISSKQAYQTKYNSSLERDVSLKTNGSMKEVLLGVLNNKNYDEDRADTSLAMCDAKVLYEAIESGRYIDKRNIILILSQRSTGQMKATLSSYKQLYGHELMKFLKKDKCGDFGRNLRTVIRCIQSPEKHFAKQLRRTPRAGDVGEVLTRTVVTRAGIDIDNINSVFTAKTGWSLERLIRNVFNSSSSHNTTDKSYSLVGDLLIALMNNFKNICI